MKKKDKCDHMSLVQLAETLYVIAGSDWYFYFKKKKYLLLQIIIIQNLTSEIE
jgi:hypothetical protein